MRVADDVQGPGRGQVQGEWSVVHHLPKEEDKSHGPGRHVCMCV